MSAPTYRLIAYFAAIESIPVIVKALSVGMSVNPYRQPLAKVRETIDAAVKRFQFEPEFDHFEEEFLLLFDAHSFLNDALNRKLVSRGLVEQCLIKLNQVKAKGSDS